jgi:enhancing lycopene biosynthesis protein 2
MPGGFGAAKNLSDFGSKGADMSVILDVEKVLKEFHQKGKPIGLCCIAPILAARVFGDKKGGSGVTLTLGKRGESWPYAGSLDAASGMGNKIEEKDVEEVCIDKTNKIITAPAYMKGDAKPNEVYNSIDSLVKEISKMLK